MIVLTPTDSLLERLFLIPDELVERAQWIVWRNEQRDGDLTKVPYQARSPRRRAKSNDRTTWATFQVAVDSFAAYLGREDQFTGIGYVFAADDPYVGVDLDDCVEGDVIHPQARRIIDSLDGYAEISPSMTGVKIWTRASLAISGTGVQRPAPWGGQIEIYHERRWFAVTGWRLDRHG